MFGKQTTKTGLIGLGIGTLLGAASAILFGPSGGRARARIRDKAVRGSHVAAHVAEVTAEDARSRIVGKTEALKSRRREGLVDDHILVERARARLGHVTRNAGAVCIDADRGRLALTGPVLKHDHRRIVRNLRRIPGVAGIDDRLVVHKSAEDVPALQGGESVGLLRRRNWSPTTRFLAGVGALAIGALAIVKPRRGLWLSPVGAFLALRSALPLNRARGRLLTSS